VSFVSVTQQFNTTTSMGRLTLNVLLSFAQFEREVTSERIKDKIAASKRKGLWVGGPLPLGYDMKDGKITVVAHEAEQVRLIARASRIKRARSRSDFGTSRIISPILSCYPATIKRTIPFDGEE
jgi:DNA invertase Pin-like site-specific DNA recombinase